MAQSLVDVLLTRKPVRCVLTDMDGTFLSSKHSVIPENIRAFSQLKNMGVVIALATGRPLSSALNVVGESATDMNLQGGGPGIYCAGGIVLGENCKLLSSEKFPEGVQKRFLDFVEANGYTKELVADTTHHTYCTEINHETLTTSRVYLAGDPIEVPNFEKRRFNKMTFNGTYEHLTALRQKLQIFRDDVEFFQPVPELLEILPRGINKGFALKILAKSYGISPDEVLVVGDSENDLAMFKVAGVAVAVANASTECKAHSDFVTVSNDDAAMTKILEAIVKADEIRNQRTPASTQTGRNEIECFSLTA